MRKVLAWVALSDDKIRERALGVSPSVLLGGGDPAKFPADFKAKVLTATCNEMVAGVNIRNSFDMAAIERFAHKDIEKTVHELFNQHKNHEEIVTLLLRMVWQGTLNACNREALSFALSRHANRYIRICALRACSVVCNDIEINEIISYFSSSEDETDRTIISQLLDVFPSKLTQENLISIISRLAPPEKYSSDGLNESLEQFVAVVEFPKLEKIFIGLSGLIQMKPHIDRHDCEVSKQFGWLMQAIAKACERLIEHKSKFLTATFGLEILSQCGVCHNLGYDDAIKSQLPSLAPTWTKLNYLSFWHDTEKAKRLHGEQVTREWQVGTWGHLWNLDDVTLDQALAWLKEKPEIHNKVIALSIAFKRYVSGGRKPADRKRMKSACDRCAQLKQALDNHLRPPAMSESERKSRQRHLSFEKRQAQRTKKQEEILNEWREYAAKNLDQVGYLDEDGEGKAYQVQTMLLNRMRKNKDIDSKWANTNWECLTTDQSLEVAQRFRQFLTTSWKHYKPQLCSEGGGYQNSTPHAVIFGLSGLGILAAESQNWVSTHTEEEAELACRYAIQEMNAPPEWLNELHQAYPGVVVQIFFREIQWELFKYQGDQPLPYALDKISWHCEWISPELAKLLLRELTDKEPRVEESLRKCLEIILVSKLASDEGLAQLAVRKIEKEDIDCRHFWFSVLISISPADGIERLQLFLKAIEDQEEATAFAMKFLVALVGSRRTNATQNLKEAYKTVEHLESLYLLMNQYIQMSEDIDRCGTSCYSPGLRDDAQDARNSLLTELKNIPGKRTYLALKRFSNKHPNKNARPWMENNARKHLENEADLPEWNVDNILEFSSTQECRPHSPKDLFNITKARLLDLKSDLEDGDDSVAETWVKEDKETKLRIVIANWLRNSASGNYSVHQEEEQADGKQPYIRLHSSFFDAPVPIELKIADKWPGNKLSERLKNQLCNDYLRDPKINFGVFLLVYRGKKHTWKNPTTSNFDELVLCLNNQVMDYISERDDIEDVEVIGIDLTKRSTPRR